MPSFRLFVFVFFLRVPFSVCHSGFCFSNLSRLFYCLTVSVSADVFRDLVRVRTQRAPTAVRSAASSAWARAMLAVSVQQAVTSTALGSAWPALLHTSQQTAPTLDRVLDLADAAFDAAGPSRLPLRGP